jgi:hypothetical protein
MAHYAFFVGVNRYQDEAIRPLKCAERDARDLCALFDLKLGFEAHYLEERKGEDIEDRIERLSQRLQPGDTFLFYFAGHGKEHSADQLFLLPGVKRAALNGNGTVRNGVLSYRSLRDITETPAWRGVKRIFMFDACRSPLDSKRDDSAARFTGEAILRDQVLSNNAPADSPLTVINACSENQSAMELIDAQGSGRGAFTAALIEEIETRLNARQDIQLDAHTALGIGQRMQALLRDHGQGAHNQQPFVGGALPIVLHRPAPAPQSNLDARLWELACTVGSIEAYEKYLGDERIPCLQKDEALARIKALRTELTTREEAAEAAKRAQEALVREAEARRVEEEKAAARKLAAEIKLREAAAQRAEVDRLAQERQSAEQAQTRVPPPLGQPEPNMRFKQLAIAAAVVAVLGGGVYVWSQRNTPAVVLPVVTPIAPVVAVSSPAELQAQRRAAEQLAQQQAAEKAQAEALAADQAAWNAIQNSSNAQDFKAYLQQYPQGQYLKQARARIKELSTLIAGQALERDSLKGGGYAPELVFIPASTKPFTMGDDGSSYTSEKPAHPVTISKSFALGKYEVTQGEWKA